MTRRAGTCTIVGAGSFTDMVEFGAMQLMVDAKTVARLRLRLDRSRPRLSRDDPAAPARAGSTSTRS